MARLEPENNILMIVNGYLKSGSDKPLVIIGDFVSNNYKLSVQKTIKDYNSKIFTFRFNL